MGQANHCFRPDKCVKNHRDVRCYSLASAFAQEFFSQAVTDKFSKSEAYCAFKIRILPQRIFQYPLVTKQKRRAFFVLRLVDFFQFVWLRWGCWHRRNLAVNPASFSTSSSGLCFPGCSCAAPTSFDSALCSGSWNVLLPASFCFHGLLHPALCGLLHLHQSADTGFRSGASWCTAPGDTFFQVSPAQPAVFAQCFPGWLAGSGFGSW